MQCPIDCRRQNDKKKKKKIVSIMEIPGIAAMHGPHSVFGIGHCTVIHCDAVGMSQVDQ